MLASPPRGAFRELLVHAVPDPEAPAYARVLRFRPGAGDANDTLSAPGMDLENLRMVFATTPRLKMMLHQLFAVYALAEAATATTVGIIVLWSQYAIVYGDIQCPGSGSGLPCYVHERETPTDRNPTHEQTPADEEALRREQALQAGLADGQALFVWAQINILLNAMLFCLNCAVGKYPLGDQQLPAHRINRRLRSLRGTIKMLSMLWYGAGSFVVWKADPTVSPPLFQYCTCVLLLSCFVWAWGCIIGSIARRCPKFWLRLLHPLLSRGLLTVSVSRAISPQRELDMVLEMSFQEEQARLRLQRSGGNHSPTAPRRRPVLPASHEYHVSEDPDTAADQQTECAICLDEFEEGGPVVSLQCHGAHTFHKGCIETWLSHEAVCPLCKFQLPTAPVTPRASGRPAPATTLGIGGDRHPMRSIDDLAAGLAAVGDDMGRQTRRLEAVLRETAGGGGGGGGSNGEPGGAAAAAGAGGGRGRVAGERARTPPRDAGEPPLPLAAGDVRVGLAAGIDLGGLSLEELGLDLQVQEFLLSQAYDREDGGGAMHADADTNRPLGRPPAGTVAGAAGDGAAAGAPAVEEREQAGGAGGGGGSETPPPSARTPPPLRWP